MESQQGGRGHRLMLEASGVSQLPWQQRVGGGASVDLGVAEVFPSKLGLVSKLLLNPAEGRGSDGVSL